MEQDISKVLTYQIKKELADRYFGSRAAIERDKKNLEKMIQDLRAFYEEHIGRDIIRLYVLLRSESLIDGFLEAVGWENRPFFDEYVIESRNIRKILLKNVKVRGWIQRSKYVHLLLDSYKRLFKDSEQFHEKREEIIDEAMIIAEEIKQFKRTFSLDEIMGFLKSLDSGDMLSNVLGDNLPRTGDLESRLVIADLPDIQSLIPNMPHLPPPEKIERLLKDFASLTLKSHQEEAVSSATEENKPN